MIDIDDVGLGYDLHGINLKPLQLDALTTWPLITKALVEKGHSEEAIVNNLVKNLIRVLEAN